MIVGLVVAIRLWHDHAVPENRKRWGDLTPEEAAVEERFAAALAENLPAYVAHYRRQYGSELSNDQAREFSEDYAASVEARTRLFRAVHYPALMLRDAVYRVKLKSDS